MRNRWAWFILILPLLFVNLRCVSYPIVRQEEEFKEYRTRAADQWELAVSRLCKGSSQEQKFNRIPPVILCHDLRVNDFIWSLDKENSLAGYLADKGVDVWTFSFRGFGKSRKVPLRKGESWISHLTAKKESSDVHFENWVNLDLPAIVDFVQKETGKDKVILIGHGFGANACAVYTAGGGGKNVARLVVLAPILVNFYLSDIMASVGMEECPLAYPDNETLRLKAGDIILKDTYTPTADVYVERLFFNRDNIDQWQIYRLYSFAVDATPASLAKEYQDLLAKGVLMSADGKINYSDMVKKITVPTLIMAGWADNFAPAEASYHFFRHLAASVKEYVELSRSNLYKNDYGHWDLVIGKNCRREVYPAILNWITKPMDGEKKL